jgi:transcriptional regulator GlxA family with amidase domain
MEIAILLFPRLTALDAVGPYDVLRGLPDSTVRFVAAEPGPQVIDDVPAPDVLVVPGGAGELPMRSNERVMGWIRGAHETSTWTTSVCTGSLLLGAAGVLRGRRATSHWTALGTLRDFGAEPREERIVVDGKIVTAAGVSSGIDMGLWLAAQIAGEEMAKAIQLSIEYDPQPPFDSGSTAKAHPELVRSMFERSRFARS